MGEGVGMGVGDEVGGGLQHQMCFLSVPAFFCTGI